MSSGTLPRDWTTANIIPVHKKGERCLVNNYRPISLTSIVVKVMEKIISRQLITALEKSGRISNNQFGFRTNRSTVTLLLSVIHEWSLCLDRRSTTHCFFLDFAKAFDSVPHEHLILKLRCLGITGQLLQWITSSLLTDINVCSSMVAILIGSQLHQEYRKALFLAHFFSYYILMI